MYLGRAICSAAILLSGTSFIIFGLLLSRSDLGLVLALIGCAIFLVGVYGCCRVAGIKLYSGQPDLVEEPRPARAAG